MGKEGRKCSRANGSRAETIFGKKNGKRWQEMKALEERRACV